MSNSYVKIFITTIVLFIMFFRTGLLIAQNGNLQRSNYNLVIVNKKGETFKNIEIGDFTRINLNTGEKVKGYVMAVDSSFFMVDSTRVYIEQVRSISTKKVRSQVIVGSVLLGGAMASFAHSASTMELSLFGNASSNNSESETFGFLGLACLAGSTAAFLPNYHKIGDKYRMFNISKPVNNPQSIAKK